MGWKYYRDYLMNYNLFALFIFIVIVWAIFGELFEDYSLVYKVFIVVISIVALNESFNYSFRKVAIREDGYVLMPKKTLFGNKYKLNFYTIYPYSNDWGFSCGFYISNIKSIKIVKNKLSFKDRFFTTKYSNVYGNKEMIHIKFKKPLSHKRSIIIPFPSEYKPKSEIYFTVANPEIFVRDIKRFR